MFHPCSCSLILAAAHASVGDPPRMLLTTYVLNAQPYRACVPSAEVLRFHCGVRDNQGCPTSRRSCEKWDLRIRTSTSGRSFSDTFSVVSRFLPPTSPKRRETWGVALRVAEAALAEQFAGLQVAVWRVAGQKVSIGTTSPMRKRFEPVAERSSTRKSAGSGTADCCPNIGGARRPTARISHSSSEQVIALISQQKNKKAVVSWHN